MTPEKRRRRRRRVVIGIVLALLAYPVLGTLALWTGFVEWVLHSEDLRVEIDNPAWTIWPGRIHMKRVGIYVNGDTQFTLEGENVVGKLRFLPMLRRRFVVKELEADGVRYRMRTQVDSTKGIEKRVAAFPPLPEIPGAKLIREKDAEKTEEREAPWTVDVAGIRIRVSELWFMEYRYLGDGTLTGSFLVGPNRMRVGTSVQDLGPGELRFGADDVFIEGFRGRVSAAVPEVNPKEHADTSFLDLVTARTELRGNVRSLRVLGAYAPELELARGKGPLRVDIALDKGWLGKQTELRYQTDELRVRAGDLRVKSDWKLQIDVPETGAARDRPRVRAGAKSTYLLIVGRNSRALSIGVHGHDEQAVLKSRQIGTGMALHRAKARFPTIVTGDLDDLEAITKKDGLPIQIQRGAVNASAFLDVDDRYVVKGPIRARLSHAKLDAAGVALSGEAQARARVTLDLKRKTSSFRNASVKLRDVSMRVGDEDVDDWWIDVASERVATWQLPPRRIETTLEVRAKDLEPVLEALAEKDQLNDLIAKFTSLDDFRARANIRKLGKITDVTLASESDVWDVSGRVYSDGKRNLTALVIGGQAVSIGFASDGKNSEIEPLAEEDWLNEKLRRFPKPVRQFAPEKP